MNLSVVDHTTNSKHNFWDVALTAPFQGTWADKDREQIIFKWGHQISIPLCTPGKVSSSYVAGDYWLQCQCTSEGSFRPLATAAQFKLLIVNLFYTCTMCTCGHCWKRHNNIRVGHHSSSCWFNSTMQCQCTAEESFQPLATPVQFKLLTEGSLLTN